MHLSQKFSTCLQLICTQISYLYVYSKRKRTLPLSVIQIWSIFIHTNLCQIKYSGLCNYPFKKRWRQNQKLKTEVVSSPICCCLLYASSASLSEWLPKQWCFPLLLFLSFPFPPFFPLFIFSSNPCFLSFCSPMLFFLFSSPLVFSFSPLFFTLLRFSFSPLLRFSFSPLLFFSPKFQYCLFVSGYFC